jgi:SAM-dependent methyltransferase
VRVLDAIHERYIKQRRVKRLGAALAPLLPRGARVLDVGCGDGRLAEELHRLRPDVAIRGVDVLVRPDSRIPVTPFDGLNLPAPDAGFDAVLIVDVLHHTDAPGVLLAEAARVARDVVIVKDHDATGFLAPLTLRFMDGVGNARFGVALPHNYLSWAQWKALFAQLGYTIGSSQHRLGIYPPPLTWFFDRSLHFVSALRPARPAS